MNQPNSTYRIHGANQRNFDVEPYYVLKLTGEICDETVERPNEQAFPWVRITEWYDHTEFWMLQEAIKQLGKLSHRLIGQGADRIAIYRPANQVKVEFAYDKSVEEKEEYI